TKSWSSPSLSSSRTGRSSEVRRGVAWGTALRRSCPGRGPLLKWTDCGLGRRGRFDPPPGLGISRGGRPVSTDANTQGEERIGGYRYVRTLHQGQNSSVMEVLQESTGRRFVMKQLLGSLAGVGSERRAFEFEAKLGMELQRPNLIR